MAKKDYKRPDIEVELTQYKAFLFASIDGEVKDDWGDDLGDEAW